jgi:hypothetical protein
VLGAWCRLIQRRHWRWQELFSVDAFILSRAKHSTDLKWLVVPGSKDPLDEREVASELAGSTDDGASA